MDLYDDKHKELVNKLKEARLEEHLNQKELAKILNKTQSFVSKLESGQIRVDAILLSELAKIFKKDVRFFLED